MQCSNLDPSSVCSAQMCAASCMFRRATFAFYITSLRAHLAQKSYGSEHTCIQHTLHTNCATVACNRTNFIYLPLLRLFLLLSFLLRHSFKLWPIWPRRTRIHTASRAHAHVRRTYRCLTIWAWWNGGLPPSLSSSPPGAQFLCVCAALEESLEKMLLYSYVPTFFPLSRSVLFRAKTRQISSLTYC